VKSEVIDIARIGALIWRSAMLHWIAEKISAIVTFVPALIVERDSANFDLIRTMFGLILIAIIVYAIAMIPFRSAFVQLMNKASALFARRGADQ
jgi:hypothetical protein